MGSGWLQHGKPPVIFWHPIPNAERLLKTKIRENIRHDELETCFYICQGQHHHLDRVARLRVGCARETLDCLYIYGTYTSPNFREQGWASVLFQVAARFGMHVGAREMAEHSSPHTLGIWKRVFARTNQKSSFAFISLPVSR